jgi:hypothetical protein
MNLKKNEMTPNELHLERAPIVEALIVIDVEPLNDETMSRVQTAAEGFRTDYRNRCDNPSSSWEWICAREASSLEQALAMMLLSVGNM